MAYDEDLAARMREQMSGQQGLTEKRMFGGLAFLIDGNMAAGAGSQGAMLLRVDPADTASLVGDPDAQRFRMRGREMGGWLSIIPSGLSTDEALNRWLAHGISYARTLPPKK